MGSASDLASYASVGLESPACPVPAPGCVERGTPGCPCLQPPCATPELPPRPEPPGNLENLLPRPASFPTAEGAKGEPVTPGPALPDSAQTLRECPCARRTRYHITITLQGQGQAPGEERGEPEPAQPALHPCGPEESRGWQEPPQGPRPITGCPTDLPQEPRLRAPPHQEVTAQQQELQAHWTPGAPHRR